MLTPRDLSTYQSPPPPKSGHQNNPTLLVSWWCTGFSLAIILVRLAGRYIRMEKLFREDKIMALSMIPLCARMALVHLILLWGTNNTTTVGLSPQDIRHREIGSRLVLASRIMYVLFLWIAKFTVSEFLKRLTTVVWKRSHEIGLQCIRWFLILTFIAVLVATLGECHPFDHYWQVTPDPGPKCRQGFAQLITMGTSDVITDLLLVCFPIPIVLKSNMVTKRKISLILLFALSLILVGITLYRVVGTINHHADQQFRSLLASLEILAAAAVSNAIVLGSFIRDRGAKKQRFRFGGSAAGTSSIERAHTPKRMITARDWGSDADLVGSLGMRCAPELTENQPSLPRPAPIALPTSEQANILTPPPIPGQGFSHRRKDSMDLDSTLDIEKSPVPEFEEPPVTPRGMSFFDVGGLLEGAPPSRLSAHGRQQSLPLPETVMQQNQSLGNRAPHSYSYAPPRRPSAHPLTASSHEQPGYRASGSNALLQDIGGLLSTNPEQVPNRGNQQHSEKDIEDNENDSIDIEEEDEKEKKESTSSSAPLSSRSSPPPSAPEVHRDISLVDVLRETPPSSIRGPSSRQMAVQRMRRRNDDAGDGEGLGFQDVGGLLR